MSAVHTIPQPLFMPVVGFSHHVYALYVPQRCNTDFMVLEQALAALATLQHDLGQELGVGLQVPVQRATLLKGDYWLAVCELSEALGCNVVCNDGLTLVLKASELSVLKNRTARQNLHQLKQNGIFLAVEVSDGFNDLPALLPWLQGEGQEFVRCLRVPCQMLRKSDAEWWRMSTTSIRIVATGVTTPEDQEFLDRVNISAFSGPILGQPGNSQQVAEKLKAALRQN